MASGQYWASQGARQRRGHNASTSAAVLRVLEELGLADHRQLHRHAQVVLLAVQLARVRFTNLPTACELRGKYPPFLQPNRPLLMKTFCRTSIVDASQPQKS